MLEALFILILLLVLCLALALSRDLLSPTSILCLAFIFAVACALYNTENWVFSLSSKAFGLLLAGVLSFAVMAGVAHFFTVKRARGYTSTVLSRGGGGITAVELSGSQAYLVTVVFVGLAALYYFYLMNTVGGSVQFDDIAYTYRSGNSAGKLELPFAARLAWNVLRGLSIITLYVIIRNAMAGSLLQNHGLLLIGCVLLYGFVGLLSGDRASALRLIALSVIIWGVLWKRLNPGRANFTLKIVVLAVVGFLLVLYGFSAIRFFVGRTMTSTPLDYITYYAGVPIYNFNYATGFSSSPSMDGAMTFLGIHNNLVRVFGGEIVSVHREYVVNPANYLSMGNVYTFMYDYYHDFGLVGIVALTCLYSVIVNGMYRCAIYRESGSPWLVCLYAFVGTTLFFTGFTEQFFSTYAAFTTVEVLATMWLAFRLFGITGKTKSDSIRSMANVRRNPHRSY